MPLEQLRVSWMRLAELKAMGMVAFFLLKAASPGLLVGSFLVLLCCLLKSEWYYFHS